MAFDRRNFHETVAAFWQQHLSLKIDRISLTVSSVSRTLQKSSGFFGTAPAQNSTIQWYSMTLVCFKLCYSVYESRLGVDPLEVDLVESIGRCEGPSVQLRNEWILFTRADNKEIISRAFLRRLAAGVGTGLVLVGVCWFNLMVSAV